MSSLGFSADALETLEDLVLASSTGSASEAVETAVVMAESIGDEAYMLEWIGARTRNGCCCEAGMSTTLPKYVGLLEMNCSDTVEGEVQTGF